MKNNTLIIDTLDESLGKTSQKYKDVSEFRSSKQIVLCVRMNTFSQEVSWATSPSKNKPGSCLGSRVRDSPENRYFLSHFKGTHFFLVSPVTVSWHTTQAEMLTELCQFCSYKSWRNVKTHQWFFARLF